MLKDEVNRSLTHASLNEMYSTFDKPVGQTAKFLLTKFRAI